MRKFQVLLRPPLINVVICGIFIYHVVNNTIHVKGKHLDKILENKSRGDKYI